MCTCASVFQRCQVSCIDRALTITLTPTGCMYCRFLHHACGWKSVLIDAWRVAGCFSASHSCFVHDIRCELSVSNAQSQRLCWVDPCKELRHLPGGHSTFFPTSDVYSQAMPALPGVAS
mmetsp:Transcript_41806/g.77898  ORF Transcript_41806/g.77898 Transcript_41806/m.77898 type:complete len:119 (+) Transcript_41806:524-880(+)